MVPLNMINNGNFESFTAAIYFSMLDLLLFIILQCLIKLALWLSLSLTAAIQTVRWFVHLQIQVNKTENKTKTYYSKKLMPCWVASSSSPSPFQLLLFGGILNCTINFVLCAHSLLDPTLEGGSGDVRMRISCIRVMTIAEKLYDFEVPFFDFHYSYCTDAVITPCVQFAWTTQRPRISQAVTVMDVTAFQDTFHPTVANAILLIITNHAQASVNVRFLYSYKLI